MSRKYLLDCSANGAKWADDVQFHFESPMRFPGNAPFECKPIPPHDHPHDLN